jgi:hypothetical protein
VRENLKTTKTNGVPILKQNYAQSNITDLTDGEKMTSLPSHLPQIKEKQNYMVDTDSQNY